GDPPRAPVCRGCGVGRGAAARYQGSRAHAGVRGRGARGSGHSSHRDEVIMMHPTAIDIRVAPSFGERDPDPRGYFGAYGGRFVPETLVAPVAELEAAYLAARSDPAFEREL